MMETSELRPMTCDLGCLSRSDGSVMLTQGDTSVMADVHGPGDIRMAREQADRATVEVIYKMKTGLPGCAEKFRERQILNTCETVLLTALHPRSCISIVVQEMQNSGSLLAASINAACLALLDAGLSMKFPVAAVSAVISDAGDVLLDPDLKTEAAADTRMTFAFEGQDLHVIAASTEGCFSQEQFQKCLVACRRASDNVFQFYRDSMVRKLSKSMSPS